MSEHKAVVWFGDDPQPNTFFFRSPFRSWAFVVNTILLVAVCLGSALMLWNYSEGFKSFPSWVLVLLLLNVVYPYWFALKRHARINEHYRSGKIVEQPVETPLNDLLEVADNSMNEGLRNSILSFGIFLLAIFFWKMQHLK
jgi:hypothetical protein